jgi:hypothetical protein
MSPQLRVSMIPLVNLWEIVCIIPDFPLALVARAYKVLKMGEKN